LIEAAHSEAEALGLVVWNQDEAGPYQAIPQSGASWQPVGQPASQAHEYERGGIAKLLTLLHPATGQVRVQGVISSANAVLHPWLKEQLRAIVDALPPVGSGLEGVDAAANRAQWERWQAGLSEKFTLLEALPPLRLLLIWDNLAGHKTPELVCWLMRQGIMPLYTPLGGSWLNMAESVQRILTRRALSGQQPRSAAEIIAWLEATARAWNRHPTPFVWGGKRQARRERAAARRHSATTRHCLGGSGACTLRLVSTPTPTPVSQPALLRERLCA
jgi:hypothetical protein